MKILSSTTQKLLAFGVPKCSKNNFVESSGTEIVGARRPEKKGESDFCRAVNCKAQFSKSIGNFKMTTVVEFRDKRKDSGGDSYEASLSAFGSSLMGFGLSLMGYELSEEDYDVTKVEAMDETPAEDESEPISGESGPRTFPISRN